MRTHPPHPPPIFNGMIRSSGIGEVATKSIWLGYHVVRATITGVASGEGARNTDHGLATRSTIAPDRLAKKGLSSTKLM